MLDNLEKNIGYFFRDKDLLKLALTHRSFSRENNERLEFLGDAMLSAVIANFLFKQVENYSEGYLSQARALLVNKSELVKIGKTIGLGDYLVIGVNDKFDNQDSMIADSVEAIVGAIYLDGGWEELNKAILALFAKSIEKIVAEGLIQHPKTKLQEWTQSNKVRLPRYVVLDQIGPAHNCYFIVECSIFEYNYKTTGRGPSKQIAEEESAKAMLEKLEQNKNGK